MIIPSEPIPSCVPGALASARRNTTARLAAAVGRHLARRAAVAELDLLLGLEDAIFRDIGTTRDEARAQRAALRRGAAPDPRHQP